MEEHLSNSKNQPSDSSNSRNDYSRKLSKATMAN